jgi:hypothetical protein
MAELEDVWIPLVDEPIGSIVTQIQAETPEIDRLIDSPRKILAFRTFAYIRVGLVLGQLLVENDIDEYDGSETWVESILRDPAHREHVTREVLAVAEEIAREPQHAGEEPMGPDDEVRERFRAFARERLGG